MTRVGKGSCYQGKRQWGRAALMILNTFPPIPAIPAAPRVLQPLSNASRAPFVSSPSALTSVKSRRSSLRPAHAVRGWATPGHHSGSSACSIGDASTQSKHSSFWLTLLTLPLMRKPLTGSVSAQSGVRPQAVVHAGHSKKWSTEEAGAPLACGVGRGGGAMARERAEGGGVRARAWDSRGDTGWVGEQGSRLGGRAAGQ